MILLGSGTQPVQHGIGDCGCLQLTCAEGETVQVLGDKSIEGY